MRKRLVFVVFCMIFLVSASIAFATSYTSTMSFTGTGQYRFNDASGPPENTGPIPSLLTGAPALDTYGPFHGVGNIAYGFSWDIPDWNTAYHWTLDIDLTVEGSFVDTSPTYDNGVWNGWESQTHLINPAPFQDSFDLGHFALADYETAIQTIISTIGGLPNPGYDSSLGGYFLDGDWNSGNLYLGLSVPIPGSLDTSLLLAADFITGGQISLTASTAPVPEPATILLLGTGLAGLAGHRIRRKKKVSL